MSVLLSPITIKEVTLRNRITISPMCQYSSKDGFANDWHLVHLGSRAVGGAGLLIQEATAISPEGRITPDDLDLWKNEHIEKLTQITSFIHQQGAVPSIQLAHAGRKASHTSPWKGGRQIKVEEGGWETVAPSTTSFHHTEQAPIALDEVGIQKVITDFKLAAERSLAAGFKLIEVHAAHGYLIHQFLSPLCNQRTDAYGGSFENRIRLLLEILAEIRSVWPDHLPLFVRISATDWADGGWNIGESVKLSAILQKAGVDLIDCSSGGAIPGVKIPVEPGYQVPFAERIKKETGILTGAVGMITDSAQAEAILSFGKSDIVLIGRESLRDAYFPLIAAQEFNEEIVWPVQYERAKL